MGWTYNTTIGTKAELKQSVLKSEETNYNIVGSGNGRAGFYVAYENKITKETFVVFFQTAVDAGCWGYKDMPLESCPYSATDLPKKLLKFVDLEKCADWYEIYKKALKMKEKEKGLGRGSQFKRYDGVIYTLTGIKQRGRFIASGGGNTFAFHKNSVLSGLVE